MTTPPEALREMGADFHHAAGKCEDAMRALEDARQDRIAFLHRCITENTDRLIKLKEEVRTLPEQIAKWEGERARLESQTGLDLLRAVVAERGEKPGEPSAGDLTYAAQPPGRVLVDGKPEDPFVSGLPPLRLREVWAEWEVLERGEPADLLLVFSTDGRLCKWAEGKEWFAVVEGSAIWDGRSMRPHGKTHAEVEAMADAREKQGEPEKPTLLDLRTLKVGTVCWTTDRLKIPHTDVTIRRGVAFTIVGHCEQPGAENKDVRVQVADTNDTWAIPSIVPARVVKEGGGQ